MTTIPLVFRPLVALLALQACMGVAAQSNGEVEGISNGHTIAIPDSDNGEKRITIAGKVIESNVVREGDHFQTRIVMLINASPERVRKLLTDYAHLDRLSPNILSSELIRSDKPHYTLRLITKICWFLFCWELVQVQDITELDDGSLRTKVLPQLSDFSFGEHKCDVRAHNSGTRVTCESDLVPKFWVPPVIGTPIVKHVLLRESSLFLENLARLANSPVDSNR